MEANNSAATGDARAEAPPLARATAALEALRAEQAVLQCCEALLSTETGFDQLAGEVRALLQQSRAARSLNELLAAACAVNANKLQSVRDAAAAALRADAAAERQREDPDQRVHALRAALRRCEATAASADAPATACEPAAANAWDAKAAAAAAESPADAGVANASAAIDPTSAAPG